MVHCQNHKCISNLCRQELDFAVSQFIARSDIWLSIGGGLLAVSSKAAVKASTSQIIVDSPLMWGSCCAYPLS
ncbi:hypothetical protein [Leptolyngbya iicbica]|uniref:Uncharacterized protein n=2 Tax=Cyanophyceae TaxID=3028117 RepID=A0A4Q7EAZ6_9CYAN|nr:hypothetical protein DYY88_13445 [Leptolyngbya sp. LK]